MPSVGPSPTRAHTRAFGTAEVLVKSARIFSAPAKGEFSPSTKRNRSENGSAAPPGGTCKSLPRRAHGPDVPLGSPLAALATASIALRENTILRT